VIRNDVAELFHSFFGEGIQVVSTAPGRINLIGEHTDYNDGFVFPAAIDRQIHLACRTASGQSTRLFSQEAGEGQEFDAGSVQIGEVQGWAAYAAGMAWVLQQHTATRMPNLEAVVVSTLPMGSGVSSSAAIELAFGEAWNKVADLGLDNRTLAVLAQRCENQFVGVNCGIMDQMASAMGRDDQAMFLDTRSLEIEYAPIPTGLSLVLCDTSKPRALATSAYNERRLQCEEASRQLGVSALRDADLVLLEAEKTRLTDTVYRRARHVVTENQRCQDFRHALEIGDLASIGRMMKASHESLRDDYEVSCPELDAMAESCWSGPGCVGARMTGAGFGGACVALVESAQFEPFSDHSKRAYRSATGLVGTMTKCRAVVGARASIV
jgi:galactokinase